MRTRFLASLGTLFTSTALAFSQVPSGYYSPYPAAPGYGAYPSYAAPGYGYYYPGQVYQACGVTIQAPAASDAPKSTLPPPVPTDKGTPPAAKSQQQAPSTNPPHVVIDAPFVTHDAPVDTAGLPVEPACAADRISLFESNIIYPVGIPAPTAVGLTTASVVSTAGVAAGTTSLATTTGAAPTSLILPGFFTAFNVEPATPQTRLFFDYGGFHGFETTNPATGSGLVKGFNLNLFTVGAELAIPDNGYSIYVRVPIIEASDNTTGGRLNDVGDVSVGFKFALLEWDQAGTLITVGATAALPTGRELTVTTNRYAFDFDPTGTIRTLPTGQSLPPNYSVGVNPVFLQPWVASLTVQGRLVVTGYGAVVIPTDAHVSTLVNADFSLGWQIYRSCCSSDVVTFITPFVNAEGLIPINHVGTPNGLLGQTGTLTAGPTGQLFDSNPQTNYSVNLPYQAFVTGGASFGFGCHSVLTVGAVTPVIGPKAFSVGGVASLNLLF